MKWADYYARFWDWAESTQISRISTLTDFISSAEVAEIANEFYDEENSSRLVKRAMQNGVRFTPAEIIELGGCVAEDVFNEAIRNRRGRFTAEQFEELECFCFDEDLLDTVAKEDGIRREIEDLPFEPEITIVQPVRKGPGFLSTLLGLASDAGSKRSHPGRCTGDCSRCPSHYGYRYGRWYYGHHHTHGCEFGGNDGSGKM
ncbi:MAG: hypothetical protein PUC00_10085 [Clostridiales bacterium]|nr:hypothetical protein [Clostridiales bacterium]